MNIGSARACRRSLRSRAGNLLLALLLLLLVAICIYPFIHMVLVSLMGAKSMKLSWDRLLHAQWTLKNYRRILSGSGSYLRYTLNTVLLALYSCALTCAVSSMAAYAFAKKKMRGGNRLFVLYLATMMVPEQVILIPTFLIIKNMGLLNTYTGLTLPTVTAFGTVLVTSFMKNVPNELLEAADIDGCGEFRKFVKIVLPMIRPVMISLFIFTFIGVWGSLIWPLVAATNNDMTTITLAVSKMKSGRSATDYGYVMAGNTVAFLPPFLLYLFLQRQFVEGIALSGIKA